MSMVAGTVMVINDGMPSYLVKKNVQNNEFDFLKIKFDKKNEITPLGVILNALKEYVVLDNLRIDELTSLNVTDKMISLYVFIPVDKVNLLKKEDLLFVEASKLHKLLEEVDMSSVPTFE